MEWKFAHGEATLAKTTVIFCVFCFKVLVFSVVVNLENRNASASEQVCSENITLSYNFLYSISLIILPSALCLAEICWKLSTTNRPSHYFVVGHSFFIP